MIHTLLQVSRQELYSYPAVVIGNVVFEWSLSHGGNITTMPSLNSSLTHSLSLSISALLYYHKYMYAIGCLSVYRFLIVSTNNRLIVP